jgi:hypothetical protein
MKVINIFFPRKNHSSNYRRKKPSAFILSILVHGIIFLIFIIIEFEFIGYKKDVYSTITLIEKSIPKNEEELELDRKMVIQQKKERPDINDSLVLKTVPHIASDTSGKAVFIFQTELADSNEIFKFARTLLDSFLILHPEYTRYVLSELAKNIEENPGDKKSFSRHALEKKINDELHKYISEKFPQGSQHEINKYTGPGINIPMGDLINIIKKIF